MWGNILTHIGVHHTLDIIASFQFEVTISINLDIIASF
jgi:hypothetical protein